MNRISFIWIPVFFMLLSGCSLLRNIPDDRKELTEYGFAGDTLNGWIRVRSDSLWGFVRADAQKYIPPQFEWAGDFSNGYAVIKEKGKYGYISRKGKRVGKFQYEEAQPFSGGLGAVKYKGRYGFLDTKGRWAIRPAYELVRPFSENRALAVREGRIGFINPSGEWVVLPQYDDAQPFKNGAAKVRLNGRFGLIDTLGKEIVPVKYDEITPLPEGGYKIRRDSLWGEVSAAAKLAFKAVYDKIHAPSEGMRRIVRNKKYGYADTTGTVVIEPVYEIAGSFSQGLAVVKKNGKWGYIDKNNITRIPFQYDRFDRYTLSRMKFRHNRAWVRHEDKTVLIDTTGKELARASYEEPYLFNADRAIVRKIADAYTWHYGIVDIDGKEILPPEYDGISDFNEYGISWVGRRKRGLTGHWLVDADGNFLSDKKYSDLEWFGSRLILYPKGQDKGFIDGRTGKEIELPYKSIYQPSGIDEQYGFVIGLDGKTGLIDTTLTLIIKPEYDRVEVPQKNRIPVVKDGKAGYYDEKGREVIPLIYDKTEPFYDQLAEVTLNGKRGAIDTTGRVVIPLRYDDIVIDEEDNRVLAKDSVYTDAYDLHGRMINTREYEYISSVYNNRFAVHKNDKVGVVDYMFNVLCPIKYERIGSFYDDGVAWMVYEGKVGYVNSNYEEVVAPIYDNGSIFVQGMARVTRQWRTFYIDKQGNQILPDRETIRKWEKEVQRIKDEYRKMNFSG